MMLQQTLRESRSDRGIELAMRRAVKSARRIAVPLPVLHAGRHIGWVHGCQCCDRVDWTRNRKYLMGWTSYDDLIAEITASTPKVFTQSFSKAQTSTFAGGYLWYDLWPVKGEAQAGVYGGSAYTAVQRDQSSVGAIPIGANVSPDTRHLTHLWGVVHCPSGGFPPVLVLYDRVLTYESCSFNASANQDFTNGVAAQRYISAGEPGLLVSLTVQTALGATSSNLTQLQYTDNDGNTLQSMPTTVTVGIQQSAAAPTESLGSRVLAIVDVGGGGRSTLFLPLAQGDTGVRLLANFTTSAANTGTMCFVLCRPLGIIPINTASIPADLDFVRQLVSLSRVYDGACLSLFAHSADSNNAVVQGGFDVAWG